MSSAEVPVALNAPAPRRPIESTNPLTAGNVPSNCANGESATSVVDGVAVLPSSCSPAVVTKRPLTLLS